MVAPGTSGPPAAAATPVSANTMGDKDAVMLLAEDDLQTLFPDAEQREQAKAKLHAKRARKA